MISGSAPARRAITGVPVARDSMATSPKGSGQAPSISVASAPASMGSRASGAICPWNSTLPGSSAGATSDSKQATSAGAFTFATTCSSMPVSRATSTASATPFSGTVRPRNSR